MQPELATGRLVLRPASEGDVDGLWALWTEPLVRRFLWDDVAIPRERAAETVADAIALGPRGLGLWTLRSRGATAGGLIGCAGLLPVGAAATFDPCLAGAVEPMVALAPPVWRQGHATEALEALVGYAFGPLGLDALVAVVDVPNEASHRLVARLGFSPLGESDGPKYRFRSYRLTRT